MENIDIVRNLRLSGEFTPKPRKCSGDGCDGGCQSGDQKPSGTAERIRFAFNPESGI